MPDTGSGQWPYPNSSATPDVPADVLTLAQRIALMSEGWTVTANATTRAALVTDSNAFEGLHVYQIDTGMTYVYRSAAWDISDLPWTSYTPTLTNFSSASTPATTTGRYAISSGIAHVLVQSKLGTGVITVGNITASLPVAADTTGMILDSTLLAGTGSLFDVSPAQEYVGAIRIIDADTVRLLRLNASTIGGVNPTTSTLPFTWATLDEISLMFSYPVA
jgi:hypothetical protein